MNFDNDSEMIVPLPLEQETSSTNDWKARLDKAISTVNQLSAGLLNS